jgi:hypothetical protein
LASRLLRGRILVFLACLAGPLVVGAASAQPRAVLELFTSQGCSSCPPADALLARYIESGGVIALSFSVDYWDYLGWPDTLADRQHTLRQQAYAAARGEMQVYTPQIVVNGLLPVVGSDQRAIEAAIRETFGPSGLPVPIDLTMSQSAVTVSVGAARQDHAAAATLWLVTFARRESVTVPAGENTGRTLEYHNVVRDLQRIAMWKGEPMRIDLPLALLRESRADGCAVLLQTETSAGMLGAILGAAILTPHGGYGG